MTKEAFDAIKEGLEDAIDWAKNNKKSIPTAPLYVSDLQFEKVAPLDPVSYRWYKIADGNIYGTIFKCDNAFFIGTKQEVLHLIFESSFAR